MRSQCWSEEVTDFTNESELQCYYPVWSNASRPPRPHHLMTFWKYNNIVHALKYNDEWIPIRFLATSNLQFTEYDLLKCLRFCVCCMNVLVYLNLVCTVWERRAFSNSSSERWLLVKHNWTSTDVIFRPHLGAETCCSFLNFSRRAHTLRVRGTTPHSRKHIMEWQMIRECKETNG